MRAYAPLYGRYDTLLAVLGRSLGWDSLYFTASTWGHSQAIPRGELADLRRPTSSASRTISTQSQDSLADSPISNWNKLLPREPPGVRAAIGALSSRLSLRDPLETHHSGSANAAAAPCNLTTDATAWSPTPTIRVACAGHMSWAARERPWLERNCRRAIQGQAHDRRFM